MARRYDSLFERLVANSTRLDVENENGCWIWTGKTDGRGCYGHLNIRRDGKHVTVKAHREMFKIVWGPLTVDETVDHLCRVGLCINPDHFDPSPVPNAENMRRSQRDNPRRPSRRPR